MGEVAEKNGRGVVLIEIFCRIIFQSKFFKSILDFFTKIQFFC
jgi:hypothetical protein